MFLRFSLIVLEVIFITILNYKIASNFYSLDVLYCLPVIQTARFSALQTLRRSDSHSLTIVAIFCALAWSFAEATVTWPNYPISALLLNLFTRAVTFTVIGRVVANLLKKKEYSLKDSLTGLANRAEFIRRLEVSQLQSERSGRPYSLLSININQLRMLNDKHGHEIGDEALKVLGETLRENSRSVDTASRMDSDEFVLLLPETDEKSTELLSTRIALSAQRKFMQNGWDISLSSGHITEIGKKKSVVELLRSANEKLNELRHNRRPLRQAQESLIG